jgi:hypothetical protein
MSSGVDDPVAGHRLLPHERWFAAWFLRRQMTVRDAGAVSDYQTLGPEGLALLGAGFATVIPGMLSCLVGIVVIVVSGGHSPALTVGKCLVALGVLLVLLGMARWGQAFVAGRRQRDRHPSGRTGSR